MLTVKIPRICQSEINHSLNHIFPKYLGVNIKVISGDSDFIEIINQRAEGSIRINTDFFKVSELNWLSPSYLKYVSNEEVLVPNFLDVKLTSKKLPVVFGNGRLSKCDNIIYIDFDLIGTIFFLLSRYEEAASQSKADSHGRFPAKSSLAFKRGFLKRPLVDEYCELLWACIKNLWPDFSRKTLSFEYVVSCDVDWPTEPKITLEFLIKHLFNRKFTLKSRLKRFYLDSLKFFNQKFNFKRLDPCVEGLKFILQVNEKAGKRVNFYFIPYVTSEFDCLDNFDSEETLNLVNDIYNRGHNIGIHPGYFTSEKKEDFDISVKRFTSILEKKGIKLDKIISRQHYLRWNSRVTPKILNECGIYQDSSLSFHDHAGFRCGTCHEFYLYNLTERCTTKVLELPLIAMDASIISLKYGGLGFSKEAYNYFIDLKNTVKMFNGKFVILWHNSFFEDDESRRFYESLIADGVE